MWLEDLATMAHYADLAEAEIAARHSTLHQAADKHETVLDLNTPSHTKRNEPRTPGAGEARRKQRKRTGTGVVSGDGV